MTNATRIWICPALCGCEVSMRASWVDDAPDNDGTGRVVSFRHPGWWPRGYSTRASSVRA